MASIDTVEIELNGETLTIPKADLKWFEESKGAKVKTAAKKSTSKKAEQE